MSDNKPQEFNDKSNNKRILIGVLVGIVFTLSIVVFEVLILKHIKKGFIYENNIWLIPLTVILTLVYSTFYIVFIVKNKESLYRIFFSGYILLLLLLIIFFVLQKTGFLDVLADAELYEEYLKKAGIWMPLVYILIQYLQVVILPIPSFVSTIAGVALFGALKATIFSLIGIILGSLTAFLIGKKVGYKAVAWMVGKDDLDKWLKKTRGKDYVILTAMFILPMFPDDILCFVAGLSSMSLKYFTIMIILSRVIGVAGTCYSINFIPFNTWWGILIWVIIFAVIIGAFILLYKNIDKINSWLVNHFKKKK